MAIAFCYGTKVYSDVSSAFALDFFHLILKTEILMSQGLLGLCCSIETIDRIERITLTAVLFE